MPRFRLFKHNLLVPLVAPILVLTSAASTASASVGICRTDPVMVLSNGTVLVVWESINDNPTDVKSVSYQVDVPRGLSVKFITYLGDVPAKLQTVTVTPDENAGNYDTYSTVVTGIPGIQTGAHAQANGTISAQTVGPTPNPLHNHLHLN
jgi:hypothetical protein